jgi:transcriptional regulator with XRE-family HTH domain
MVVCVKKLNLAGRLVNKLRNERGWTQDELADRLRQNDYHENGCSRRELRQKWQRILCSYYIS